MTMTSEEIANYYDKVIKERRLSKRIKGPNKRMKKAISRIEKYIDEGDKVLDIGCGIGVNDEVLLKRYESIMIYGLDISNENIDYAKHTIKDPRADFYVGDVLEKHSSEILELMNGYANVIILIDVLEHIPSSKHDKLFKLLSNILSNGGYIVLTYPSPSYQDYLMEHKPDELQIVDEKIFLKDIVRLSSRHGFFVDHYSREDIWKTNQYVHTVLTNDICLDDTTIRRKNILSRFISHARSFVQHRLIYPYKRWKYIKSYLSNEAD